MQIHRWRVFPEHKFEYSSSTTLSPPTIKSFSHLQRSNGFLIWYCGIRPRIPVSSGMIKADECWHREKHFLSKGTLHVNLRHAIELSISLATLRVFGTGVRVYPH